MVITHDEAGREATNGPTARWADLVPAGVAAVFALSIVLGTATVFAEPGTAHGAVGDTRPAGGEAATPASPGGPVTHTPAPARGDAAFRRVLRRSGDPPDPAQVELERHLEARSPGTAWTMTPLPFVVDRWSFFEVTPEGGDDVDTERFAVDAKSGVVAAGNLVVLGEILHALDILGAGTTEPFDLARIAGCVAGSRSTVLSRELLEGIPRPGELRPPSLTKADGTAQLVFYEQRVARGRLHSRCQVDIAADYSVAFTCTQYRR